MVAWMSRKSWACPFVQLCVDVSASTVVQIKSLFGKRSSDVAHNNSKGTDSRNLEGGFGYGKTSQWQKKMNWRGWWVELE